MTNTAMDVTFDSQTHDNTGVSSPVKLQGTQSTMGGNFSKLASSHASQSTTGVAAMMADLDRIQSEQVMYGRKIELEKKKGAKLEMAIIEQKDQLQHYRDVTKNGRIVKDDEAISKKMIGKLEYQVAQARNKLSSIRKENQQIKTEIIELRKEKMFQFGILTDLKKEIVHNKKIVAEGKEEINVVNNKKQRTEVDLLNMKNLLFTEMDDFGKELEDAKQNVQDTQASILDGIREKFQSTFTPILEESPRKKTVDVGPEVDAEQLERDRKISAYLKAAKVDKLEELITLMQNTEETMFAKYNDVQQVTQEAENMEIQNKHLEQNLSDEMDNLAKLEASSGQRVEELEEKINTIYESTEVYHESFAANMVTLNTTKKELEDILYNFSLEEDPTDQALLAAGITWRNIPEFLGQVEQRIDELIQMMKAAKHEHLNRIDFARPDSRATSKSSPRGSDGISQSMQIPNLPSSKDADDEEDDVEAERIQPINVGKLKTFMAKKMKNSENATSETATPPTTSSSAAAASQKATTMKATLAIGDSKASPISSRPPSIGTPHTPNEIKPHTPHTPESSRASTAGSGRRSVLLDTRSKSARASDRRAVRSRENDGDATEIRLPEYLSSN